ncbi:MAG: hypothetical protein QOI78_8445 [Actinomycetota bacterium]|jgi:hypothetical protein|nr:hypothetical protein [Actinomycetota bacterium]
MMQSYPQRGTRLLIDHGNLGLLGWLGAGFAGTLVCYLVATAIGIVLTGWAIELTDAEVTALEPLAERVAGNGTRT